MTGETGGLFEERVLGVCAVVARRGDYLPYDAAMEVVLTARQPPIRTPTVTRILRELRILLGETIQFRSALGSVLDYMHGVDGVFVFDGVTVTIDVTKNTAKDATKADVLVCEEDLGDLPALARRIAREFERRLGRAQVSPSPVQRNRNPALHAGRR